MEIKGLGITFAKAKQFARTTAPSSGERQRLSGETRLFSPEPALHVPVSLKHKNEKLEWGYLERKELKEKSDSVRARNNGFGTSAGSKGHMGLRNKTRHKHLLCNVLSNQE